MRQEAGEWVFFFFKQKTAYELRISDWSSDVCSSDLPGEQIVVPNLLCAIGEPRLAGLLDKAVQVRRIGLKIDDRVCGLLQAARATAAVGQSLEHAPRNVAAVGCYAECRESAARFGSHAGHQIGRASCRARVCQYVEVSVVAVALKKKNNNAKK